MSNPSRPSVKRALGLFVVFVFLGVADLFLTWKLIHTSDGQVLESNPVAAWWLDTYGWGGMAAFKGGMILLIGGLAASIAFLRPRTSELLLVFACGAQSTVVVYSVFLMRLAEAPDAGPLPNLVWDGSSAGPDTGSGSGPRRFGPGSLPENGPLLLLGHESVQEELQLSAAQVEEIKQLADRRRELRAGPRRGAWETWQAQIQDLLGGEKALTEGLRTEQAQRLRQIAWQQRGPFAFTDPEVSEALQLTAQQQETIRTLVDEARKARPAPSWGRGFGAGTARKAEEDASHTRNQLWAVLTADQAARWKEMTGKPFKSDLLRPNPASRSLSVR